MCIKWSRILHKSYDKHKFCCTVAFRSVTRVGNRLEFKLVLDLIMGHSWLLRPYCILPAEFWQTHDPHPLQQNSICPGCGCCCAPAVGVLFLHFEQREQRRLCWEHSCLGRKSLSVTTSGLSTRGSTSTGRAPTAWLDLFAQGGWSKSLGKALGVSWSPGFHLHLENDDFSCAACRAISSLSLCSPFASGLPGSGSVSSLSPLLSTDQR